MRYCQKNTRKLLLTIFTFVLILRAVRRNINTPNMLIGVCEVLDGVKSAALSKLEIITPIISISIT